MFYQTPKLFLFIEKPLHYLKSIIVKYRGPSRPPIVPLGMHTNYTENRSFNWLITVILDVSRKYVTGDGTKLYRKSLLQIRNTQRKTKAISSRPIAYLGEGMFRQFRGVSF